MALRAAAADARSFDPLATATRILASPGRRGRLGAALGHWHCYAEWQRQAGARPQSRGHAARP